MMKKKKCQGNLSISIYKEFAMYIIQHKSIMSKMWQMFFNEYKNRLLENLI